MIALNVVQHRPIADVTFIFVRWLLFELIINKKLPNISINNYKNDILKNIYHRSYYY